MMSDQDQSEQPLNSVMHIPIPVIAMGVLTALLGIVIFITFPRAPMFAPVSTVSTSTSASTSASFSPTLNPDLYPLYPNLTWEKEIVQTFGSTSGHEVRSIAMMNVTDLSALTQPFEKFYADRLTAKGWTIDNTLAAGGPGSDITAYKKGDDTIILGYTTLFKGGGENAPAECPCDITFSIFSGTAPLTGE